MAMQSSPFLDPLQVLMQARAQQEAQAKASDGRIMQLGAAALPLLKGLGGGTPAPQAMPAGLTLPGGMDPQTQAALQGLAGSDPSINMAQQYPWLFGK